MFEDLPTEGAEDPYREIVHASPDAILIHSGGKIVYANPSAAALLAARDPADLVGMRALDIVHPDFRDVVRQRMADEENGVEAPMLDEKFLRLDGSVIDVEVAGIPFVFEGKPAGQITARDIGKRKTIEEQLREAEARFRALVETVPAVTYIEVADDEHRTTYISPQIEQLFGLSQEDYLSDSRYWETHLHPEDRERAASEYLDFLSSDARELVQEYRMIAPVGRVIWVQDRSVIDRSVEPNLVQGLLLDITDEKLAEETLRRRDAILGAVDFAAQRLLRAAEWREVLDDVLAALGNAAAVNTVGIWETSIGDDGVTFMSELTHEWAAPGAQPRIDDPASRTMELDDTWLDWVEEMRSGRPIAGLATDRPEEERDWYIENDMISILDVPIFVDNAWWGIIGFEDPTERTWPAGEVEALRAAAETLGAAIVRERAAQQLRETEQRYRALVEQIPAVLYIDKPAEEDRTVYISPQVQEILGLSAERWMASPDLWYQHLHPDDQQRALLTYRRGVAGGKPFSYEYRMDTPRGLMWIRDDAVVLKGDDGTPLVQGVMFDVTEQKLAEEALLESEGREREAAQQLRQLDAMKNTFLAAVSHELRSPLTSVLGLALTLEQQRLPPEEQNDLLRRLASNARKLQRLLADLLDIDRLSRGVISPQRHTTDVGALVQVTVEAADFIGDRSMKVEAEPVIAAVDGAKVERIVENLLVNASRHTPEGTTIWVRVKPFDDGVLITVEDDGPGVPDEIRRTIFEPFRQGPTYSSHTPGTGIGLTLVQRFTELHGGRVWIEDREGGGVRFNVYLPSALGSAPPK